MPWKNVKCQAKADSKRQLSLREKDTKGTTLEGLAEKEANRCTITIKVNGCVKASFHRAWKLEGP